MRRILLLLLVLSALLPAGCDVHQFPEERRLGGVVLHLHYEPDFWVWDHLYDPMQGKVHEQYPDAGVDEAHPGTTSRYDATSDHGSLRILIRAFRPGNLDHCLGEYLFLRDAAQGYDCDVELDLAPGEYVLAVWSDLTGPSGDAFYYDPADFRRVQLRYAERYDANTDFRDGYRGRLGVTVEARFDTEAPQRYAVTMRRPMAKFEFITTDLSEFLEKETNRRNLQTRARIEDYRVEVIYTGYLPSSYSVIEDRLENAATGVRFVSEVQITGESEASLGFDYVLINDTQEGAVLTEIAVYDRNGEQVARSHSIEVPLRRDHHTVLRGAFLTLNAQGGVGVDPGYDGDHNVIIP